MPISLAGSAGATDVTFAYTKVKNGDLVQANKTFTLTADKVFTAIGQSLGDTPTSLHIDGRKIAVDQNQKTSVSGVWAGGDCASGGDDLTVTAVADGRDAAINIDSTLRGAY